MKIATIPFANDCINHPFKDKTVVVIDVLRATSTMITALMHGVREIIPVVEIVDALEKKGGFLPSEVLLCGERSAGIIPGFDLGNSPFEYTDKRVGGKTLIMSTTNGTRTISNAGSAKRVILASFLNAGAVASYLQNEQDIVLFCSGTNGRYSADDALCAGYIASMLAHDHPLEMCDLTQTLQLFCDSLGDGYIDLIKNSLHGKLLINKGFGQDVDYCLQKDITSLIPFYDFNSQSIKSMPFATS